MSSINELAALRHLEAQMTESFQRLYSAYDTLPSNTTADLAHAQQELVKVAQRVVEAVQGPVIHALHLAFLPMEFMAVGICVDLELPRIICSRSEWTLEELACETGANASILNRLLRLASRRGYFEESGVSKWKATPVTHALALPAISSWVQTHTNGRAQIPVQYNYWLKENKYQQVWGKDNNPVKNIFQSDLWTYFGKNSYEAQTFNQAMKVQELFPPAMVPQYSISGTDPNEILLVDVGGGTGQAIPAIKQQCPGLVGKFILQDLPETIDSLPENQEWAAMSHDFFTPQPVKDAKFYHFRRIFHDWHDDSCLKILEATRPALKKGYSKLLIHDLVLPDCGADYFDAGIDVMMMCTFDGIERTESGWRALLQKAGFVVDRICLAEIGRTAIIEASLAE